MNIDKILGTISAILGVLSFIIIAGLQKEQIVFVNANNIFIKYIMVVFAINAGAYFLLMGVLLLKGQVVSYFSERHTPQNQAWLNIIVITTMVPTVFWFTGLVVTSSHKSLIAAWLIFLCLLGWELFSGFKVIRTTQNPHE